MLKYNVPGMDAFTSCGITDERDQKAIYTRVRRARSKEVEEECAATLASLKPPPETISSRSPPPPSQGMTMVTPGTRSSKKSREAKRKREQLDEVREAAIKIIPAWMDKSKTKSAMAKRAKRSTTQVNQDNFDNKAKRIFYGNRFSVVWKLATTELFNDNVTGDNNGKRGFGERAVAQRYNATMLTSPSDRKIKPSTLGDALGRGRLVYPPKSKEGREKSPMHLRRPWQLMLP